MTEHARDERAIFLAALERTPQQRNAFVEGACADDPELLQRVRELLQTHDESMGPLDSPPPGVDATIDQPITEKPGTVIDRYKLLEQIGEGGFGLVFMAEQEESVRRKVALKIIKPGMDTKEVIARFEAERQALAIMDHPNIAKVLDAGATESGRPYFVMELVRGLPITNFCDQNSLTARERLELFAAVCQAVQHAHQKGIIHRDIKPSNVLVTMHDDKPVPKVIDFGVAKATNARLTERTLFTRFAQMVGPPLYMSPEQAQMSGLDVDTRSDIYSLGVLLYELLTGTTPFDKQRIREAAYDEFLRIIREEEPPRPSLRISTLGETLPSVAAHRKVEPKKLSALVRGELDWIVMKALEKDRTRRYETANGFARDIERYLNDEPVTACPPSATYRFKKFARRNKAALATAAVVAVALLVGIAGTTWQAIRATDAREDADQAREEETIQRVAAEDAKTAAEDARRNEQVLREAADHQRERAEANLHLALEVLDEIYVWITEQHLSSPTPGEGDGETLLHGTLDFYERFAGANRSAPEVRSTVEEYYRKIAGLRETLVEDWPAVVGYRRALAITCTGFAALLQATDRQEEAREAYGKAVAIQQELVDAFPAVAEYRHELAASRRGLANLPEVGSRDREALRHSPMVGELERRAEPLPAPAAPRGTRFADFQDLTRLQLLGDAAVIENRLRLTPAETVKVGGAWSSEKQLVGFGFETVFQFRMDGLADGFAFVVQNHSASALGSTGSGLGYGQAHKLESIPNSLAIEFDTYAVPIEVADAAQHVSVQTNGTGPNSASHAFLLAAFTPRFVLNDGDPHTAKVRYVPGSLTIFLDGATTPGLTVPVELAATLDLDRGRAWVGFTGATGLHVQTHEILSWEFRPLVEETNISDLAGGSGEQAKPTGSRRRSKLAPAVTASDEGFMQKVLVFYESIAQQNSTDPYGRLETGRAHWRVGDIQRKLGDEQKAMAARCAATETWAGLVQEFPDVAEYQTYLVMAQRFLRSSASAFSSKEDLDRLKIYGMVLKAYPEAA